MKRREFCKSLGGVALVGLFGPRCGGGVENEVEISVAGGERRIICNGIPDHPYGTFPNAHDPESIRAQSYDFRVPAAPVKAAALTTLAAFPGRGFSLFGVGINGVPFDPVGPWFREDNRSGWMFEVMSDLARPALGLDMNNAHTQAGGRYHYHGMPVGLIDGLQARSSGASAMLLAGYAADGFPIYDQPALRPSYRLREGTRPTAPGGRFDGVLVEDYEYVAGYGDLDECNGHEGPTPEYPDGTYYYLLSATFPFIPRLLRGTPDQSFSIMRGANLGGDAMTPPRSGPLPPELWAYSG